MRFHILPVTLRRPTLRLPAHRFLLPSLVLITAALVSAAAPALARRAVHNVLKTQSLGVYFPAAGQYPKGYKAVPVQQYPSPSQLFANGNVSLARRDRLVIGALQTAINRHDVVATILIARFRTPMLARWFKSSIRSDVTPDGEQASGTIRDLGSTGARYVTGDCTSCGPTAPPLYQVFFARGALFVEVGTQPRDRVEWCQLTARRAESRAVGPRGRLMMPRSR